VQYAGLASDIVTVDIIRTVAPNAGGEVANFRSIVNGLTGMQRTGSFDGYTLEAVRATTTAPITAAQLVGTAAVNVTSGGLQDVVSGCFDGSFGCVVTLRTTTRASGEASCQLGGSLTFGASFKFPLSANRTVAPTSVASGVAYLDWFVTNDNAQLDTSQSVWVYAIDYFDLSADVVSSGLYNGQAPFPTVVSTATVGFDVQPTEEFPLRTGNILGVAIQHSLAYNVNTATNYAFLYNCSLDYCYAGVSTMPFSTPILELRGQLIAGVGALLPSLVTLFCLLIALVN